MSDAATTSVTPLRAADTVRLMAAADVPVGWRRAPLLVFASAQLGYFLGWAPTLLWLASCLALEVGVFFLCRKVAADERQWRRAYIIAALCLPWCWISYACMLWVDAPPAMHLSAVCALFIASMYVVLCNHYDRRIMLGLMAAPAVVLFIMVMIELSSVLPWFVMPMAVLNAFGMLAILFQSASLMHRSNAGLRDAQEDLTQERDALDQRVQERTVELELATRRANADSLAKSQFLANMSHELRTPLNAVIGYSEILKEDLKSEGRDESAQDADRIRAAGRHLLGLINDLLDLAKVDTHQLKLNIAPVDVALLLQRALDAALPSAIARGNRLEARIGEDVTPMMCDPARVNQAVNNLLSNACKFTKDGVIALSAKVVKDAQGEMLVVQVRDTGIGIAPAEMKRLFQPFSLGDGTTTRSTGGAGLGLIITRNIARLMGGDVTAESTQGKGSIFTLRLPRTPAKTQVLAA